MGGHRVSGVSPLLLMCGPPQILFIPPHRFYHLLELPLDSPHSSHPILNQKP